MIMGSLPLSIFASGSGADTGSSGGSGNDPSKPYIIVESLYSHVESEALPEQYFRALPDDEGLFYFDIILNYNENNTPDPEEEFVVYYRTVDDTAVAAWGDYESVGAYDEAYVVLNKANGYKSRVAVQSTILDYASVGADGLGYDVNSDNLVSRRFIFELTHVDGDAELHKPASDSGTVADRNRSRLYCYLRADVYVKQSSEGSYWYGRYPLSEAPTVSFDQNVISTDFIKDVGSVEDSFNVTMPTHIKNLVATGKYNVGISIIGLCKEGYWNSDGPVTFDLYYTYQGKKQKAFTLILEGEFDDSQFFGFEHAFDYATGNYYDDEYHADVFGYPYDIDDYIEDNFYGFILYDNDGNVSYKVTKDSTRDVDVIKEALLQCLRDGYAFSADTTIWNIRPNNSTHSVQEFQIHWLQLPSNFVFADSYSWCFTSEPDDGEKRKLENILLSFCAYPKNELFIVKDDEGYQMVTTNIDQMKDGDNLKLAIRFNQLACIQTPKGNPTITAKINGKYDVTLELKQLAYGEYYYAFDTFVFEGELPDEVKGVSINSLTDIKINYVLSNSIKKYYYEFQSFMLRQNLMSATIDNIYGYSKETRVPLAMVNITSTDNWTQSKALDIYVNTVENPLARFNDYVTVYYQWSDSPDLPKTYSSKLVFNTKVDGDITKTIIGKGAGQMYLHLKAVSSYGKSSISDMKTETYVEGEGNTYTPFGPFKFDNTPPELSANDIKEVPGSMKERTIIVPLPNDKGGVGVQDVYLYYVPKNSQDGEGVLLKKFTAADFSGGSKQITISHKEVGVGVDPEGNEILDRGEITFYWLISDRLGNTVKRTAEFTLVFDTNDYLSSEIESFGPADVSDGSSNAQFVSATKTINEDSFIYNYELNAGKTMPSYNGIDGSVYYAFSFTINDELFAGGDKGVYTAIVKYKGAEFTDFSFKEIDGSYTVLFTKAMDSGKYDIQLKRTEGESVRVSKIYSVYATNGEKDSTEVKDKIETGTLLSNTVYQLSTKYYYKDDKGNIVIVDYNGTKQAPTFSTYAKAKEYVYYKELGDIYLIKLTAATASALVSGTTGYFVANGETVTPQADQYWIRYKSAAWTPTSGDSAWVYYYYGLTETLSEGALSQNLQAALNEVSNRIVGYGKSVVLTDTSIFLGSTMGDNMLDKYGMPYLAPGQIHSTDELSKQTMCGNVWSIEVAFAADKNIYKSNIYVGEEDTENYTEYPIVGNFVVPEDSIFQYMTYEEYNDSSKFKWTDLKMKNGETFVDVLTASGVYYIREIAKDGVSVFAVYVDKEVPKVSFSNTDDKGNLRDIPVDPVEILDIRTKDLIIGSIDSAEYDRLSYVAIYKVSNLSLVGIYTANDLDSSPVKLQDGTYYIVVADRSGNSYTVTAKVSSTDLECQIKETEDKQIKLICNRRKDQIVRYEVYLNGKLVTSTYETEQVFTEAGLYKIYILDIFGNEFVKDDYIFSRSYPEVTWKYVGSDGRYHTYDINNTDNQVIDGFVMTQVAANSYKISTSVKTRFSYTGNYEFEFIGAVPEYEKSMTGEASITIEAGQSFTLKVYYKNHKDCYTIYSGVVDVTPPSISVFADVDVLQNGEYSDFNKWISAGKVDDVITMEDIYYVLSEIGHRTVVKGGTVSSDIIRINAADANELSLIEVYLNGTLLKKQDNVSGFTEIVVSKWGNYRVVAKDTLGNVSEFTFTNGMPSDLEYSVDGIKGALELHGYLLFDENNTYTKVDYGKRELKLDIKKNADVFMSVGVSGGTEKIYGFRISDGKIYQLYYTIALDKNGKETVSLTKGKLLLDMSAEKFDFKNEYVLNEKDAHAIYAKISTDGVITLKVYASDDASKIVSVGARVEFDSSISFVSAELSGKISNVTFNDLDGNKLGSTASGTDVKLNDGFVISEAAFNDERILSVSLYYSKLNDLSADSLSGKTDIYEKDKEYFTEGFYLLVVKNRFGNDKSYKIAISRSFGITSSVTFGDGHKIYYTKDHTGTIYSNNEITLDIVDDGVTYSVTKNGAPYTFFALKKEDSITYLVFSDEGIYEVKLTDSYGNVITKRLEINKTSYEVADELLVGYNEKALKRQEGYTNTKLSVDKAVFDREGIYYLAIKIGEKITVLFDDFAETPVSTDANGLINVIGNDGDGVYTVIIRNRYGAVVTKTVHYRATPTLHLERTTRSNSKAEAYDLNYALSLGFWSNNTLVFKTDANVYIFTVNKSVTECPRTLVFDNGGDYGSTEYDITYIDEYGFEYIFKAYLVRKNVAIELPAGIGGIEINGVLNTQNNVSITFGEQIYATYTLNNGEDILYTSGEVLKKDGTYRFTVTDYAGNTSAVTIKKDTMAEFALVETGTGNVIQSGGVVNSSKVDFKVVNKDSVYIEKMLKDGVLRKDYTDSKFTEDGKWELIVCDKLGNKAYFCFYIVTRAQNGFSYTTPYEYHITEMWYDSGEGAKISYMNFVDNGDHTSSFSFIENGKYTVVMTSDVTGNTSSFNFTINTNAPEVSLVGCNVGETTINDVTIDGCKVGDRISIYRVTENGEELVQRVEINTTSTKIPTISEGGNYRVVVESEAGVETELTFVRKHVMNTAGSIFIMVIIGCAVIGLFTGLVYRNKSKTDD